MTKLGEAFRSNRLAFTGLLLMLVAVAALGWIVVKGGARTGSTTSSLLTPAVATPNPQIAEFKQLTMNFLEIDLASAQSGSAAAEDVLCVPGSQAIGDAGINSDISRQTHSNFMTSQINPIDSSWTIHLGTNPEVRMRYKVFGHDASWPKLVPSDSDHEIGPFAIDLVFQDFNGKWLVLTSD